ncbi:MAG: endonuclease III [Candidatus Bathyarchaeia archaeon]
MDKNQAQTILQVFRKNFAATKPRTSPSEPFKTLIATIISQNTSGKNAAKAFEKLSSKFKITPRTLANAETREIEECLKVAGLYRSKAKTIKQASRTILNDFGSSLEPTLSMPLEEAREKLMQIRGVGPKTADVVLLFCARRPTIPVDTHVNRVAKRLGFASDKADYELVRTSLQSLFSPNDYLDVHVLLIRHGRTYCKARKPLCSRCPISSFCSARK